MISTHMQPTSSFLTQNEKDILKARYRQERDKKFCDRIKSILLLDNGWSYVQVGYALLLDEDIIRLKNKTYLKGGKEALLNLNYTGKACKLNQEQLVVNFIKKHFCVQYTVSAVVCLLHHLNFEYKKPKLVPGKVNVEDQALFFKKLKTLEMDLCESDEIIYIEGVYPQYKSKSAKALLKANNLEVTTIIVDSIKEQCIVEICDNASCYRSKLVSEYFNNSRIEIKFLPPYSSNLNLAEYI